MIVGKLVAVIVIGYLLGSLPFGLLISRRKGNIDLRERGSGKIGATNVLRTSGGKLAALVAMPVLKRFKREIDPRRYNGASLLGLRGIVVKSHGGADALAFETAIKQAIVEIRHKVPEKISSQLESMLVEGRGN